MPIQDKIQELLVARAIFLGRIRQLDFNSLDSSVDEYINIGSFLITISGFILSLTTGPIGLAFASLGLLIGGFQIFRFYLSSSVKKKLKKELLEEVQKIDREIRSSINPKDVALITELLTYSKPINEALTLQKGKIVVEPESVYNSEETTITPINISNMISD